MRRPRPCAALRTTSAASACLRPAVRRGSPPPPPPRGRGAHPAPLPPALHPLRRRPLREGVWGWAKYGRLSNLAADDKDDLWDNLVEELVEVKFQPDLLRGFIRQTGLPGVSLAA